MIISVSISVTAIEHSPAGLTLSTLPGANVSSVQTIDVIGHFDICALSAFAIIVVCCSFGRGQCLVESPRDQLHGAELHEEVDGRFRSF